MTPDKILAAVVEGSKSAISVVVAFRWLYFLACEKNPVESLFLEALGEQRCLAVDAVNGYENISVSQLPPLLDHGPLPKAGCFGYALLKDGAPCAVVSIRHLLNAILKKEGSHARA